MTRNSKVTIIVVALILELFWLSKFCNPWPHGEAWDVSYRRPARVAAFFANIKHQTPATEANWQREMRLLHKHERWKIYSVLGLLVGVNGILIYYFWSYDSWTAGPA